MTAKAEAALLKLRALAEGNGPDPAGIVLLGAEDAALTLKGEMLFSFDVSREPATYPGPLRGLKDVPPENLQKLGSPAELESRVTALKEKWKQSGDWVAEAARQLKEQPGEGWGIESADITLDDKKHIFYVQANCQSCAGRSTVPCTPCNGKGHIACGVCHGTGLEICYGCNGSGHNSTYQNQYCSVCNGATQIHCRQCRGTRMVPCPHCRGQGAMSCKTCNGQGIFTTEEKVQVAIHANFRLADSGELPSVLRRALSRGGMKSLTRGHATITAGTPDQENSEKIFIPYTATLPFTDMRLKFFGKPVRAAVMGHKNTLLDIPAFLDAALEPRLQAFEAEAGKNSGLLAKALDIRLLKDAFGLLQAGKNDVRNLRALYPYGLSPPMAERVLQVMQRLEKAETKNARWIAGGLVFLFSLAVFYGIGISGVRLLLANSAAPVAVLGFDLFIMALAAGAQLTVLREVAQRQLQKRLSGKLSAVRAEAGGTAYTLAGLTAAAYAVMLFALKVLPAWNVILAHPLG
jgi:hypothetical protein